jgi:hypothetical protein
MGGWSNGARWYLVCLADWVLLGKDTPREYEAYVTAWRRL